MESRGRGERGERGSGRGRGPFQGARGGRFGSDGSRGGFNGGRGGFNDGRGGFIGGRNGSDGVRGGFSGGRNWSDGGRDGFSGGRSRSHGGRDGYRGGRGGFDNGGRNDFNGGRGAGNQQFEYQSQLQVQFGTMSVVGEGSSSGGQQQFSGDNYAAKLSQPSHPTTDRGLVPKTQLLKLSDGASLSSDNGGMVPVTRPDKGGTKKIFSVNILVNHFPVRFNPESIIRHYDIDVKPVQQSTQGRLVKISKANLSMIMDKLFSQHPNFPQEMTAFDGEKNIFSAVSLPVGIYKVVLSPEEGMKCLNYEFSVTLVNELRLHKLKDYLTGNLLQLPRDVLQGMDVVMKENPRKHMVGIGKSFHPIDPTNSPLSRGLLASQGFQHSLKPTSQGMALCLDYSVLAVRKRTSVLEFLREHINLQVVDSRHFQIRKRDIESALKGLKVTVTHRLTKQKYIISGLTEYNARDISFNKEDPANQESKKSVRLVDYFKEKYPDNHIKHEDIPCLCLGKGKRNNYVPIEFCVLVEGQRFPKDNLDRDSALLLKDLSLASPHIRREKICGLLQEDHGPTGGVTSKKFEIEVEKQMTQVQGRVIAPPTLKLRSPRGEMTAVDVDNSCQWNLVNRSLVEGKSLKHWAVLDFSYRERATDRLNEYFISKLVARCEKLGIQIEPHPTIERSDMGKLQRSESVADLLERLVSGAKKSGKNLQLILCVMTRKDHGYNYIKWVSETKIGVVTQCCLSKMANKMQDQYLANLGMKINAKLGGSNVELFNKLPSFGKDEDRVMLIGADVNHPRPLDASSPSIAAVVASMNWPAASKYVPRISQQRPRMEEIDGFGRMCLELVKCYEKLNGAKPQRLVIFRDGVSEAQFDMVLNKELLDLLLVMKAANYRPTITLIVARKRHQTRLFPQTPRDGGSKGNIYPGTVVDTTIIHPREFDFYLCSHFGSIGTSKPTHYHVLWDENGFSSDDLQKFIYDLCFTFARCCKPVSLVPPVYYADLLAYRGRLYFEAQLEKQSCSSSVASSSSTCASWSEIALHSDIENVMYFI